MEDFDLQLFKKRHTRGGSKRAGRRVRARAHSGRGKKGMEHLFGRTGRHSGRKTVRR